MSRASRFGYAPVGLAGLLATLCATPAMAHHVMDGKMPSNIGEGLLSGLAHPVIGLDHFAFVVGVGLLMSISRRWLGLPVTFAAMLIPGVFAHVAAWSIGPEEFYIALSVFLIGAALLAEKRLAAGLAYIPVALAGFAHGYAFGETIVGAEQGPLLAYLVGLCVVTLGVMLATAAVARRLVNVPTTAIQVQKASGIGLMWAGSILIAVSMTP